MPTVNRGQVTSFDDQVGLVRDVSDLILMLDPYDTPLMRFIPGLSKECTGTKHEWLEDSLVPVSSKLAAGIDGAVTQFSVTAGEGPYFLPDDVIKVDDEVMIVTAVNGDQLTVFARGHGSTDPAAHLINAVVTRVGVAKKEGADAGEPRFTEKTADYNFTQIFEETVKVTGTREAVLQYGVVDEYARQLMKVLRQRAILVEQALIHGVRDENVAQERRTMGGLLEFCNQNKVNAGGAALTKAVLDKMIHDIWRKGGEPRTLVMNIDQKARLAELYADRIRTERSDKGIGNTVDYIENDLGRFNILLDRWVPRDKILVLDRDKLGFGPLRGRNWSHTYMGKKGDYRHGQILGEFTVEVRGRGAHGVISNLAYTP